jgi:hypothetical protein
MGGRPRALLQRPPRPWRHAPSPSSWWPGRSPPTSPSGCWGCLSAAGAEAEAARRREVIDRNHPTTPVLAVVALGWLKPPSRCPPPAAPPRTSTSWPALLAAKARPPGLIKTRTRTQPQTVVMSRPGRRPVPPPHPSDQPAFRGVAALCVWGVGQFDQVGTARPRPWPGAPTCCNQLAVIPPPTGRRDPRLRFLYGRHGLLAAGAVHKLERSGMPRSASTACTRFFSEVARRTRLARWRSATAPWSPGVRSRPRAAGRRPRARSASDWTAPEGSSLLTLDASSVQTAPNGSRRIVWDDQRLPMDKSDGLPDQAVTPVSVGTCRWPSARRHSQ